MRALLVDDDADRATAVAARDLGLGGWSVGSASSRPSLASLSRFVDAWYELPPIDDEDSFVAALARIVEEGCYDVILTTWDSAADVLSRRRVDVSAVVPLASPEAIALSLDKRELAESARSVGIDTPRAVEATDVAIAQWRGPAIVKAAQHQPTRTRTQVVRNADEMRKAAARIQATGAVPLLQELVEGVLEGIAVVLTREGRVASVSYQVTEAAWPVPSGVTVRARTLPLDEGPVRETLTLLEKLEWLGIAQVQYLRVGRKRVLIDFNPRLYGSVSLAIAAGARHPTQWARVALDLPVVEQRAVPGMRYQWFVRDLRAQASTRGLVRGAASALRLAPDAAHSMWARDDPMLLGRYLLRRITTARWGRRHAHAGP